MGRRGIPTEWARGPCSRRMAWIRPGSAGEADEELAQVAGAKVFRVAQGADPTPVDDLAFAQEQPDEEEAQDAGGVEYGLAPAALIPVAQAGNQPGQQCGQARDS